MASQYPYFPRIEPTTVSIISQFRAIRAMYGTDRLGWRSRLQHNYTNRGYHCDRQENEPRQEKDYRKCCEQNGARGIIVRAKVPFMHTRA